MAGAVEYTNCIFTEGKDTPLPTSVLDMTLNIGEALILKLWGMWNTPSLPLLPGPPSPGVVAHHKVQSMGQIELFDHLTVCKQMTDVKLNY